MTTTFDFLPQSSSVEGLLNACVAALPHLPLPEKDVVIKALRDFETFTAPTMWSAADVDGDDDLGLTDDEKRQCIANFSENYGCKQADWDAIEQCAREVVDERGSDNGGTAVELTVFKFFSDPGHGWLEVPMALLYEIGISTEISSYSYRNDGKAYLEEDRDLSVFLRKMEHLGRAHKIVDQQGDAEYIRRFDSYHAD